jgi:hypothetical protein
MRDGLNHQRNAVGGSTWQVGLSDFRLLEEALYAKKI